MKVKHRAYLQENNPDSYNNSRQHMLICHSFQQESSEDSNQWEKILKAKDNTIHQLKEMLQVMQPSTRGSQREQILEGKVKSLQKQIKVLKIENECLINVIQNNNVNIPSGKQKQLQQQIDELNEQISRKQEENTNQKAYIDQIQQKIANLTEQHHQSRQIVKENNTLKQLCSELQSQCTRLMQLFRQRQRQSIEPNPSINNKTAISKIRQQYEQNIKLTKQYYSLQISKMQEHYSSIFQSINNQMSVLEGRLEKMKGNKEKKVEESQPCQQIQYLLQKYYQTQKDLQVQKQVNHKLSTELSQAHKTLQDLSLLKSQQCSSLLQFTNSVKKNSIEEKNNAQQTQNCPLKQLLIRSQSEKEAIELKMQTVISCYQNQLQEKMRHIQERQKMIQTIKQSHANELEELKQKVTSLQSQIKNISNQFQAKVTKLSQFQEQKEKQLTEINQKNKENLEKAQKEIKQLIQKGKEAQDVHQNQKNNKNIEVDKLQKELINLRQQLAIMSDNSCPLQLYKELNQLRTAVIKLSNVDIPYNCLLQLQYKTKIQENMALHKKIDRIQVEMVELQRMKLVSDKEKNVVYNQLKMLQAQLKEKSVECQHLRKQNRLISGFSFRIGSAIDMANLTQVAQKWLKRPRKESMEETEPQVSEC